MRIKPVSAAGKLIFCGVFLAAQSVCSQMPAALGKVQITSTPAGASAMISRNGSSAKPTRVVTPVTLAVAPGDYTVTITGCAAQPVKVGSGETKTVSCPPQK